jgi:membrane-associated phospholipid phosphatase
MDHGISGHQGERLRLERASPRGNVRRRTVKPLIAWILAVLAWGSLAWGSLAKAQDALPLRYDLRLDLPLTLGAATLWGTAYLLNDQLVPSHCRWCDDNPMDARARAQLRWSEPLVAGKFSDVAALVGAPLVAFGGLALAAERAHSARYIWQDALFVFEAISVAALANQIVKVAVARERPYAHYDAYAGQKTGSYERTSFYSAHTSRAFALASAAGMVASMRGYRLAPLIWTLGLAMATFVGYTRVAGDYHYLSDVLVGAAVGSLLGAGLPWLLHRPQAKCGRISVSARGVLWTWQN